MRREPDRSQGGSGATLELFGAPAREDAPAAPAPTFEAPPPRVLALHLPELPLQRR